MRRPVHSALAATAALAAAAAACGADEPPRYRFEEGDVRRFRLTIEEFPLGHDAGETRTATLEYVETVEAVETDGVATLRVDFTGGSSAWEAETSPLPSLPEALRIRVAPDGRMLGGGAAPPPLWLLPRLPDGGEERWKQKTTFGRRDDVIWHVAAEHEWGGEVGRARVIRSILVVLGDRHPGGTEILHDPSTTCAACEIVAEGRGLGTTLVDLEAGAVREAVEEWAMKANDPGPGRVGRLFGRRVELRRLD